MIIKCSKPVYLYIHVCMIGNYMDILHSYRNQLKDLDLIDYFDKIMIGIVGRNDENMKNNVLQLFSTDKNQAELVNYSENVRLYERLTLHSLYDRALHQDFHVLYLHTKGVTHSALDQGIIVWRNKMLFFMLHYISLCLHYLEHDLADVIGIDFLRESPRRYSDHFSGNFWWTTSNHIRRLHVPINGDYLAPEMWICSISDSKRLSLYQTPEYNFYKGINLRNRNKTIHDIFNNNQLSPEFMNPGIADLFLEDLSDPEFQHYYGHPPNWTKITETPSFRTGIFSVDQAFLGLDHDPYLGKIKFWIFSSPQNLFSCLIEHRLIAIRSQTPKHLKYSELPEESTYGSQKNEMIIQKSNLIFEPNIEIEINNNLFSNVDPDYGQLKKWTLVYDGQPLTLVEHQKIVITH